MTSSAPAPIATRRLRVVFCVDSFEIGGTELNAVRTAERLDRDRYDLSVVCLRKQGPLLDRYVAAGIPVREFPISSLYGAGTIRQGLRLARFLREQQVDIFHAHDIYTNVFGVPWARLAGVPGVIASRRWFACVPRRSHMLANRWAYRFAHRVLANSPGVAELLVETENVPQNKAVVVPNFLDEEAFEAPSPTIREEVLGTDSAADARPVVGIVANLSPVKDHQSLLRAVALLRPRWPKIRLVMVGDGFCRPALEALTAELEMEDHVVFAGRRATPPNLHHLFDVSVLCSLNEGLSNSILEAMAAGKAAVATDVGATSDAVIDGKTGFLVPPSDPQRLAAALEKLLLDPELAGGLGAAGQTRARAMFSAAAAFDSLYQLYEELALQGDQSTVADPPAVEALDASDLRQRRPPEAHQTARI